MKIFPKNPKSDRGSNDFYFGDYGEIPIGLSFSTINEMGSSDDKLHYHKKGIEFYLVTQGVGTLQVENQEVELNKN